VCAWKRIGANLRAGREARGLSRAALAGRCALDEEELGAIERGEVKLAADTMLKLEDALAMPRGSSLRGVNWDQRNLCLVVEPPPEGDCR
jgi:transcriptional regulator with XRE-family HTH domain